MRSYFKRFVVLIALVAVTFSTTCAFAQTAGDQGQDPQSTGGGDGGVTVDPSQRVTPPVQDDTIPTDPLPQEPIVVAPDDAPVPVKNIVQHYNNDTQDLHNRSEPNLRGVEPQEAANVVRRARANYDRALASLRASVDEQLKAFGISLKALQGDVKELHMEVRRVRDAGSHNKLVSESIVRVLVAKGLATENADGTVSIANSAMPSLGIQPQPNPFGTGTNPVIITPIVPKSPPTTGQSGQPNNSTEQANQPDQPNYRWVYFLVVALVILGIAVFFIKRKKA